MDRSDAFDAASIALLGDARPSTFFRALPEELRPFFPELLACVGVPQSPVHHPEGDVFEHTMLVTDCAAALRGRALHPLGFMLAALLHDLGKVVATQVQADGRITAYGHEVQGLPLCERQMRRLTDDEALIGYVKNMMWLHMRPNVLAGCRSKKKKTRELFDLSVCPEDLILLSRADASGKLDAPYDPALEAFLTERLADYRAVLQRPMVTRDDLIRAGVAPEKLDAALARARQLHFAGQDKRRALRQAVGETGAKRGE